MNVLSRLSYGGLGSRWSHVSALTRLCAAGGSWDKGLEGLYHRDKINGESVRTSFQLFFPYSSKDEQRFDAETCGRPNAFSYPYHALNQVGIQVS